MLLLHAGYKAPSSGIHLMPVLGPLIFNPYQEKCSDRYASTGGVGCRTRMLPPGGLFCFVRMTGTDWT
jgi:hypothetical protein